MSMSWKHICTFALENRQGIYSLRKPLLVSCEGFVNSMKHHHYKCVPFISVLLETVKCLWVLLFRIKMDSYSGSFLNTARTRIVII